MKRTLAFAVVLLAGCTEPPSVERPPTVTPPTAAVAVGGHPGRIALGDTGLWVTVYTGRGRNQVVRVDPHTNRVTARIPVRGGPFEIATARGAVWVTGNFDSGNDVLYRIDPRTERVVATIPLPGHRAGALAAGPGAVWVVAINRQATSSSLVEVDPSRDAVVRRVRVGAAQRRWVTGLTLARGDLWLLALRLGRRAELPGDVIRFNPRAGRVTARIEAEALSMAVGPGGLWTSGCLDCGAHRRSSFARRIDLRSKKPVGPRIALRGVSFGPLLVGRERVWFGGYQDGGQTVAFSLEAATHRIDRFLRLGSVLHTGMAVDPDGKWLWVAKATGTLLRVELSRR
jgi:YVTN family beta-propeller protein